MRKREDDRVYDPCCGTGGFLIAALKRMVRDAGNDAETIRDIKENRLFGAEVRADMFTYACSNMMMRGDGKSHIYNEDCFSSKQKNEVRKFKPTVAFLNPPYSKNTGPAEQLDFVLNALEDLEPGGRCAAIVQMSAGLVSKGEVKKRHKALMKKHRLEAVVSMPDQLFYPIGVNTCVMVFKAHDPHSSDDLTWLGYLKDDGFIIHKKKGRIPVTWDTKRAEFLSAYPNYDRPGLSIRSTLKFDDEWLAEAYLETDFSILRSDDFQRKIRDFLGHEYVSGRIQSIENDRWTEEEIDLDFSLWKKFRFDEIFNIRKGYYNKKPPILDPSVSEGVDSIDFIGATEYRNGLTSQHDIEDVVLFSRNGDENPYEDQSKKIFPAQSVTVSNNGSVGFAFYQPRRFTSSHDVNPLYLKGRTITPEIAIFVSTVIEVDRYRWGYGRKWRPARMPSSIIELPADENGQPHWEWMEKYVRTLEQSANLRPYRDATALAEAEIEEF